MEFDNIRYLHGCLENERGRLQHLIGAAKSGNQPLDNSIIKGQEEKISNLEIKIKKLESENE
jgi:hypothetical protein|tara:strand:- start:885 stop:1070 length:186 start_codon:yes stop_codon:yes gene_type:complete